MSTNYIILLFYIATEAATGRVLAKKCSLTVKRLRRGSPPPPPERDRERQRETERDRETETETEADYHKPRLSLKFHCNSSSLSEDMRIFSFNINYFSLIFWIFWHFLVAKKLMASAYKRWCQHLLTFNLLYIGSLKFYKVILILDQLLLKYERWIKLTPPHPHTYTLFCFV